MQILIGCLILLFASWMLWFWLVGDSHEIKWMRKWGAIIFVGTVVLVSVGGTAGVTAKLLRQQHRADVTRFAVALESRLREGDRAEVDRQLARIIDPPDEWSEESGDILVRMANATNDLLEGRSVTMPTAVPSTPKPPRTAAEEIPGLQ
ncbi:MAG: hypothetical protein KDA96_10030 [Planctomycetaceae bacterium]|nr:hypothetical protein [Planctomycetaceae bacterium]